MSQSLSVVYIHLIFSTKNRIPYFKDTNLKNDTYSYLGGVSKNLECSPLIIGGTDDHVHLLCRLGRTISVAKWVRELKRVSNGWVKQNARGMKDFAWQSGYGAFSVSASNIDRVREYISGQEKHHQKMSFQDEFRTLLRKHGVEWNEQYVWD
jgi:REP element-mobilizing transposase RayT